MCFVLGFYVALLGLLSPVDKEVLFVLCEQHNSTLQTVHLSLTFLSHLLKEIFFIGIGLTVIEHQKGTETRNHITIHGNDAINVPLQILLAHVLKNCSHFAYKINVYHFCLYMV